MLSFVCIGLLLSRVPYNFGTLSNSVENINGLKVILLLPYYSNLTVQKIIHIITVYFRGSIFNKSTLYLAYAYYDVTIGKSKHLINEVIQKMEELNNDIVLRINVHKTKYMNTAKYCTNTKICNMKQRTLTTRNINKYQNLNI